ncbi:MAG: hypothetical protein ACTSPB_13705, partial [Candidatus Thorarchaeota archaeon]
MKNISEVYRTARLYKSMKQDESDRMKYYDAHPEQVKFILDFFGVSHGIRPRGAQYTKRNGKPSYEYTNRIERDIHGGKYGYPLTDLNKSNIKRELRVYKNFYFFPIIYDTKARHCDSKQDLKDLMIGITPTMDIDSINIDPDDASKGRVDLLADTKEANHATELIEEFRVIVKKELTYFGLWNKTRLLHSGNGLYVIMPDLYGSLETLNEYASAFYDLKRYINSEIGMELTHEKKMSWGQLFKIPFTFHNKYHRVSIPLN